MRDKPEMAMLVSDTECATAKVWQPWYIDERDGVRKALPTRALRDYRTKERMLLHRPNNNKRPHSPSPPSDDEELDVGEHELLIDHHRTPVYSYAMETYDDDLPLDMSIKRRSPPLPTPPAHAVTPPLPLHLHRHLSNKTPPPPLQPPPAHTPAISPPPYSSLPSRGRPSVITCAPTPWILPPPPYEVANPVPELLKGLPTPAGATLITPSLDDRRSPLARGRTTTAVEVDKGQQLVLSTTAVGSEADDRRRHVVQAGPIDPEIDEHFRRSLGKNYQALFVCENPNNQQSQSNDSVDDHFAKALGATWTKIKAQKDHQESPLSPNVTRASPAGNQSPPRTPVPRISASSGVTSPRPGPTLSHLFPAGLPSSNGFSPRNSSSSYTTLLHPKTHLPLTGTVSGAVDKESKVVRSPSGGRDRSLSGYQPVL